MKVHRLSDSVRLLVISLMLPRKQYGIKLQTSRMHTLFGWMALSLKFRQNGKVINKTIYLAVGLNSQSMKEALTMLMQRTMSLHTKSAEERYKEFLQIPDFMQKIPFKYILHLILALQIPH